MTVLFAVGVMDLFAVAALALFVLAEKTARAACSSHGSAASC